MARGSSPLTRGKRKKRSKTPSHGRLIPAHAGKTVHSQDRSGQGAAHPRSRGENEALTGVMDLFDGLIPAHAGKTPTQHQRS